MSERGSTTSDQKKRSGVETGVTIYCLIRDGDLPINSAGVIAERLKLDESYVRRTCRTLVNLGVLSMVEKPQPGTPRIKVFSAVIPK